MNHPGAPPESDRSLRGGVGLGLRARHFEHITTHWPEVDWFEILSENFMHTGGRPMRFLDRIAERYPITMHGVSLNIGSIDALDLDYLAELGRLRERARARIVSDHLCWTGVDGTNLHDLLPLPYTEEALTHLASRVRTAQDVLGTQLVLENPSTYLEFEHSTIGEPEFLHALAEATGCGLLLDVNNVFVCAQNHGFDADDYLRRFPWQHLAYVHLAGHSDLGSHVLDTHDGPVSDAVWRLYERACQHAHRPPPTMVEWDAAIPDFEVVHAEARLAGAIRTAARCPTR